MVEKEAAQLEPWCHTPHTTPRKKQYSSRHPLLMQQLPQSSPASLPLLPALCFLSNSCSPLLLSPHLLLPRPLPRDRCPSLSDQAFQPLERPHHLGLHLRPSLRAAVSGHLFFIFVFRFSFFHFRFIVCARHTTKARPGTVYDAARENSNGEKRKKRRAAHNDNGRRHGEETMKRDSGTTIYERAHIAAKIAGAAAHSTRSRKGHTSVLEPGGRTTTCCVRRSGRSCGKNLRQSDRVRTPVQTAPNHRVVTDAPLLAVFRRVSCVRFLLACPGTPAPVERKTK